MEFCVHLELCEPSTDKPKGKKPPTSENAGKRKADDMPTKLTGKRKFYCNTHGRNKTHNTKDYFELKWRVKRTKTNTT
eukprot:12474373-Ditylum_brightwellii.AAC.2